MDERRIPPIIILRGNGRQTGGQGNKRNEVQKKVWVLLHQELQQTRNPSPTRVKVPQSDGTTRECVTKEQVEEAIGGEIDTRFSNADSAQVYQEALSELL